MSRIVLFSAGLGLSWVQSRKSACATSPASCCRWLGVWEEEAVREEEGKGDRTLAGERYSAGCNGGKHRQQGERDGV